uniref:Cell adhesion molecule L1-like b n=1 Tax=Mola mola TaxID=94237 RepID=A0A3Q3WSJ5_MOLML
KVLEQPPTIISHTSGPITALPFDRTVEIKCEAKGNPPPEYRWTKDGENFIPPDATTKNTGHSNGTFVLHEHFSQFQGKYRCYVSNKLGTAMTEEIELTAPRIPKFPKEGTPPIVVTEGEPIILHCNPPEGPAPRQLYWMSIGLQQVEMDERVSMGIDGNLYFSNALQNDSRQDYCCFASFPKIRTIVHKTAMKTVLLKAAGAPPVRIPSLLLPSGVQTEKVVLKGEALHLECIPQGYPTPKVRWMKMGEKLPPRTKFDNFGKLLTLPVVEERDGGKYMCTVKNSAGEAVHYFDVIVEEPPKWLTEPPRSQLTVIGSDVHVKCSVSGKPLPDITWRRNGELFRDDPQSNRRVLDDTLVLHNARPEDSAVYQCDAFNSHGSLLANINIMVMSEGCETFSPRFKDETQEAIKGVRFFTLQNGPLRIIGAEKSDSGKYVCVAFNTEGKSAITAVLDIKVDRPKDAQIISGTTAQLVCQAEYDESLQGSFEVEWRKDGEDIPLSFEENSRYVVDDGMLQIMNVNLSDQGMYTCIARTSLDEENATAIITILEFIVEFEESQWQPGRWKELQKVPGNQATAELELHGHLNYEFRVYAVNALGPGPPSDPTERYKTPPAAPDRNPENIKIQGHLPHQMDISWEPLMPIEHNGPGLEYKMSYRRLGVEDVWKEHLLKRHSFVARNTSTFVPYEIKIQSRNSHGWGPEPKVITGYSGEDVPTAAPRDIAVEVFNTTVLRVSWTPVPPATVRGHLGGYNVHWLRKWSLLNPKKILDERGSMSFSGKRTRAIMPALEPFSEYRLTVNVFNKKGNGPSSEPVTFSTPEGVPILTTSNAQKDSILLVWGPPLEANGILTGYLLQYHLINETTLEVVDSQEIKITEADTTQWQLRGLKEGSLYRFLLSACTRAGCGPPLAQESSTAAQARDDFSTQGWIIGTMCAVALLTLIALMVCFVIQRNKGGKYAVKEKENLHPDVESQGMNDDTFCEHSDSEEKPLKGSRSLKGDDVVVDSVSRDSLVEYADGGREFSEDGSFIGEYSGHKHSVSVSEPRAPSPVTA